MSNLTIEERLREKWMKAIIVSPEMTDIEANNAMADWWLEEYAAELQAHTDRVVEVMALNKKKLFQKYKAKFTVDEQITWWQQKSFNDAIDTSIQIVKNLKI